MHSVYGCVSTGVGLTPSMRLVAGMMLMWGKDWSRITEGRYGMTIEEIADRTSLAPVVIERALEQMVDCKMVERRADGWRLTIERWQESVLPFWLGTKGEKDERLSVGI